MARLLEACRSRCRSRKCRLALLEVFDEAADQWAVVDLEDLDAGRFAHDGIVSWSESVARWWPLRSPTLETRWGIARFATARTMQAASVAADELGTLLNARKTVASTSAMGTAACRMRLLRTKHWWSESPRPQCRRAPHEVPRTERSYASARAPCCLPEWTPW